MNYTVIDTKVVSMDLLKMIDEEMRKSLNYTSSEVEVYARRFYVEIMFQTIYLEDIDVDTNDFYELLTDKLNEYGIYILHDRTKINDILYGIVKQSIVKYLDNKLHSMNISLDKYIVVDYLYDNETLSIVLKEGKNK